MGKGTWECLGWEWITVPFVKHKIANFALSEVRAQPGMDREGNPGTKPCRQHSQKPLTSTGAFWLSSVVADGPPLWLPGNQSMLGFSCFSSGSGEERKLFKDNKHLSNCRAVWFRWASWAVASSNSRLKTRKLLWELYLISKYTSAHRDCPQASAAASSQEQLLPGQTWRNQRALKAAWQSLAPATPTALQERGRLSPAKWTLSPPHAVRITMESP